MTEGAKPAETIPAGNVVYMTSEEVLDTNFRVLHEESDKAKPWIIPREEKLDLLFFRQMFTKLTSTIPREEKQGRPAGIDDDDDVSDEIIPIEVFQRAFERLVFILRDPNNKEFDAKQYDENGNGLVGWGEFCYVYKNSQPSVCLSIAERIFLTFEQQESSKLAKYVSNIMLLTIMVSSMCFILSTVDECRDPPVMVDGVLSEPQPMEFFVYIEYVCLALFVLDYTVRLATSWAVRAEIFERTQLLEMTVGVGQINLANPGWRFLNFVKKPANLVDLAAILPSIIEIVAMATGGGGGGGGGGFVVLRLVRLTRVLRVFKDPKIKEPVEVIETTIKKSTKALYVLGFNLLLGIVIFGSLMWVVEQGEWNPETQSYQRQEWDGDLHMYVSADTPFVSIPHSFWWAIVTATTVGYGDHYPVTTEGYMVAVATMLYSLVIGALPVGVIGGTFSNVWEEYEIQKKLEQEERLAERARITRAVEKINPTKLRNLMLVEVWNERFLKERPLDAWGEEQRRPNRAEFMGQYKFRLDLPRDKPVIKKREVVNLEQNPEIVLRPVTGQLVIEYSWDPGPADTLTSVSRTHVQNSGSGTGESFPTRQCGGADSHSLGGLPDNDSDGGEEFTGRLTVTLISADGLLNLNLHSKSNPFAFIFCYPNSPKDSDDKIKPSVWRSQTLAATLSPQWNAGHSFSFKWNEVERKSFCDPSTMGALEHRPSRPLLMTPRGGDGAPMGGDNRMEQALDGLLRMRDDLMQELQRVKQEVSHLGDKVDKLESSQPVERVRVLPPTPDLVTETVIA